MLLVRMNNEIGHEYVELVTPEVMTWATALLRLYNMIDKSKIDIARKQCISVNNRQLYMLTYINETNPSLPILFFSYADGASSAQGILSNLILNSTSAGCYMFQWAIKTTGNTYSNTSGGNIPIGTRMRFYYN